MVVDGAGCYHVLSCLLLCTTLKAAVEVILPLCIVERNSPTLVRRRLSLTHAGLGKNILDGTQLTYVMESGNVFPPIHVPFVACPLCYSGI